MGIYIKGMKMPVSCWYCDPDFAYAINCSEWKRDDFPHFTTSRPDTCPLTEVPEPHGDLVDHSEIGEILIKALDECEISEADKSHVLRMVWIAPTVIEGTE